MKGLQATARRGLRGGPWVSCGRWAHRGPWASRCLRVAAYSRAPRAMSATAPRLAAMSMPRIG